MSEKNIILFDGVCNLCSRTVQEMILRDTHNRLQFASLQSHFGQQFLNTHQLNASEYESFIFIDSKGDYSTKSTAFIRLLAVLGGKYLWGAKLLQWVPPRLRDKAYEWIAKNRYRWFGKKESCWLPNSEILNKFMD